MATDRSRAMPRVDAVWNHPVYQERYRALQRAERDRAFCSHDLQHFLDVARIAWTVLLERGVAAPYADALSGGEILGTVEQDKRFSSGECEQVLAAIAHHRTSAGCAGGASAEGVCSAGALADALRYADKAARACYACPARELCNWPDGKKNLTITW